MLPDQSPLPSATPAQEPSLNSTFGLPESFRKFIAGGLIAATAFLAGCAKTLEERVSDMKALPTPPVATLLEHPDWFKGDSITVRGTPHFERDESYSTKSITMMPICTGKSVIIIPQTRTTHHSQFLYTLNSSDGEGKIEVRSESKLDPQPLVVAGEIVTEGGNTYLKATDQLTQREFESARQK